MVAVFAAGALWFVLGEGESSAPIVRGALAPDFAVPRFVASLDSVAPASEAAGARADDDSSTAAEGATAQLTRGDLAGRVAIVNFWATWCEPCEQEMPAMQRLSARLPRDRFELVAISIDEEPAKITDFVKRYGITFPIGTDPTKRVATAYQTTGVPESLLVDQGGRIVERYVGPREWDAPEHVARIESLFEAPVGSVDSKAVGGSTGTR